MCAALALAALAAFVALLWRADGDYRCPPGADYFPVYNRNRFSQLPEKMTDGTVVYRIAVVTDLDHDSKSSSEKNTWNSYMRLGSFTYNHNAKTAAVKWDEDMITLKSTLSQGGRGMELSDLVYFDGHLLTVDDRTGVVYRIEPTSGGSPRPCKMSNSLGLAPDKTKWLTIPWVMLADGDGTVPKGFKAEWLAVKDDLLYVGGLGKEWTTTDGVFQNYNPMFVKVVTHTGFVRHVNWTNEYINLRAAAGIKYPGYMIHESGRWSEQRRKWFFLPRRASNEKYTEADDERRGSGSAPVIIALKSEEDRGNIASYITVFDLEDNVLMAEQKLEGAYKFEGVEFF